MKKYKLLKDFLDGKAGDIYEQRNIRPSEYENITRSGRDCLQALVVERYPDWFEEVNVDRLVKFARNFYKEREDNAKKEPEYIFWNDKKYEVENRTGDISKPERMIIREVKEESQYISLTEAVQFYQEHYGKIWSDNDMIEFAKLISFKGLNPTFYRSVENDYRHLNEKYKELLKCIVI